MNLTGNQVIAIIMVVLGVATASTAQLTDLIGPTNTKIVVSIAGLLNTILSGIMAVLTSQGAQVKAVLAMEGVQKVDVNEQANKTLAQIAIDPTINKISPTVQAVDAVTKTAEGK